MEEPVSDDTEQWSADELSAIFTRAVSDALREAPGSLIGGVQNTVELHFHIDADEHVNAALLDVLRASDVVLQTKGHRS